MTTMLVNYWNLREQIRHNQVSENETIRHNQVTERNDANRISLGYAELAESIRHNKVMEDRVDYQNALNASQTVGNVISALGSAGVFAYANKKNNKGENDNNRRPPNMKSTYSYKIEEMPTASDYTITEIPEIRGKEAGNKTKSPGYYSEPIDWSKVYEQPPSGNTMADLALNLSKFVFAFPGLPAGIPVPVF